MEMEVEEDTGGCDFLEWLCPDTSYCVFHLLDDPADLACAAAVSRSWRRFVIDNGFCKSLCRRICPEVANFTRAAVVTRSPSASSGSRTRETDHAVYSCLGAALVSDEPSMDCILQCIGASSTDHFPDESIDNTLVPQDRGSLRQLLSYWSSGGEVDPEVPESLTYRLNYDLCMIDEVRIRPFKAFFQIGGPIYSSKAVRIRLGHSKLSSGEESLVTDENENLNAIADENYVWTYTSPEFPMLQEQVLQTFKLPRPALCIGGVVKIELLGRIQKPGGRNDKYYICVWQAQVMGRSLSPEFMVDISDPADYSILKYLPGASNLRVEYKMNSDTKDSTEWRLHVARYRQMWRRAMVKTLLGP